MKLASEALLARIDSLVDRSGGPEGCHPWTGLMCRTQPVIWEGKVNYYPRRVVFERAHGPLRPPARVHAKCKNTRCMNLAHLMGGFENYFHAHVDRSGGPDACWPWTGMKIKGYGRFGTRHRVRFLAHRVAYELANGPIVGHIPGDPVAERLVMHLCDNPPCCNPKHLRVGTDAENIADCVAKGRNSRGERHGQIVRQARIRKEQSMIAKEDT